MAILSLLISQQGAQAIFVLRITLSYTMMAWSRMRTAMSSATSMTRTLRAQSERLRHFALLVMRLIQKRCRVSWKKAQRVPIGRVNPIDLDRVAQKSTAKPGYGFYARNAEFKVRML